MSVTELLLRYLSHVQPNILTSVSCPTLMGLACQKAICMRDPEAPQEICHLKEAKILNMGWPIKDDHKFFDTPHVGRWNLFHFPWISAGL